MIFNGKKVAFIAVTVTTTKIKKTKTKGKKKTVAVITSFKKIHAYGKSGS